ncbi:VOC family protein [Microbacterium paludicola]|uniref:VOC family protein n=1 Tax=Microbacterium paludicola TaxID=300019 RepID=A0A4Y9FV44_9MICO|nr:VOC family protein [Microbacterium paludicola]MBF0816894.1 VOC family protein [Microbacterium paludicola]TFU32414.1 VOC family protein [Microbacterium paludicola]
MPVLNPYLTFRDTARQAMEFYQSVFGGELEIETFGDSELDHHPDDADLVLHAVLETPDGMVLMASDTPSGVPYDGPGGHSVSISGDEEEDLSEWWEALSEGGSITLPLSEPDWGGLFGMCTDRFGVKWMISILDEEDLDEDDEDLDEDDLDDEDLDDEE